MAVTVEIRSAASNEAMTLSAIVARQNWVPDEPLRLATGGMGLRVIRSCAAWLELLGDLAELRKPARVGDAAMRPLRQVPPTRCGECGRERTTLWSELCGWCSGKRPRGRNDRDPSRPRG
jgi:hypothetical protein